MFGSCGTQQAQVFHHVQVIVDLQIKSVSLVRLVVTSSWDCPDPLDLIDGCVCQFSHYAVAV